MQRMSMPRDPSRRAFLDLVPIGVVAGAATIALGSRRALAQATPEVAPPGALPEHFPQQDPVLVRDVVGASHARLERVRELVEAQPSLAKAAYDWGFGDWETALGAASHVGRRDIAELLMHHGARPDIFTWAMLGNLDAVKAMLASDAKLANLPGPHSITLYAHAVAGGDGAAAVRTYLEGLPDVNRTAPMQALDPARHPVYLGEYSFGAGADDCLVVGVGGQGVLQLRRGKQGTARNLFHLGDHTFYPAGAEAVRIVFGVQNDVASVVTVHDPGPLVSAKRID